MLVYNPDWAWSSHDYAVAVEELVAGPMRAAAAEFNLPAPSGDDIAMVAADVLQPSDIVGWHIGCGIERYWTAIRYRLGITPK